jgi:hypothetical protein
MFVGPRPECATGRTARRGARLLLDATTAASAGAKARLRAEAHWGPEVEVGRNNEQVTVWER